MGDDGLFEEVVAPASDDAFESEGADVGDDGTTEIAYEFEAEVDGETPNNELVEEAMHYTPDEPTEECIIIEEIKEEEEIPFEGQSPQADAESAVEYLIEEEWAGEEHVEENVH